MVAKRDGETGWSKLPQEEVSRLPVGVNSASLGGDLVT